MNIFQGLELLRWKQAGDVAVKRYQELRPQIEELWKQADAVTAMDGVRKLTNYLPGSHKGLMPATVDPLINSLVGGLAGAGLGYGIGYLGEKMLPEDWRVGRLRRTLALAGGLAGASPGLFMGATNLSTGRPFRSNTFFQHGYDPVEAMGAYNQRVADEGQLGPIKTSSMSGYDAAFDPYEFNQMVWQDPRVNRRLRPEEAAAASGLITGAASLNNTSNLVTPVDIARMAVGMGSGYVSGALVGKTLGLLMGMPDSKQELLKNTGMMAGLIRSVVPMAFGG